MTRPGDHGWYGIGHGGVRPGRPGLDPILPELLVGEYPNPHDVAWLKTVHGVGAILSLQDDADLASKRLRLHELREACRGAGVDFARIPVPDGDAGFLAAWLPEIVERLHAMIAGGSRVYLHCNAGMNRAPTAAIAYVHVHLRLPLEEATAFVKARRLAIPYVHALQACYPGP